MRVLPCAVLLAGCYDFSRFGRLDGETSMDGAGATDLAAPPPSDLSPPTVDLAASSVLVEEPFDSPVGARWYFSTATGAALSIDPTSHVEGTGALRVDLTKLASKDGGMLWKTLLPSDASSLHLRFYARHDTPASQHFDIGGLLNGQGGVTVAVSSEMGVTEGGLDDVANGQLLEDVGKVFPESTWTCFELAADYDGSAWSLTLTGRPAGHATWKTGPVAAGFTSQPTGLQSGAYLSASQPGTKTLWLDALELRAGSAQIGCPY